MLCLDGVYVEGEGGLRFEAAPAPTLEELEQTLKYIYARAVKWLARDDRALRGAHRFRAIGRQVGLDYSPEMLG